MSDIMSTTWLCAKEVAELFDVSSSTIRRLLSDGQIDGIRVGGLYRVDLEAIEKFIDEQRLGARRRSGLHRPFG